MKIADSENTYISYVFSRTFPNIYRVTYFPVLVSKKKWFQRIFFCFSWSLKQKIFCWRWWLIIQLEQPLAFIHYNNLIILLIRSLTEGAKKMPFTLFPAEGRSETSLTSYKIYREELNLRRVFIGHFKITKLNLGISCTPSIWSPRLSCFAKDLWHNMATYCHGVKRCSPWAMTKITVICIYNNIDILKFLTANFPSKSSIYRRIAEVV
jgi:hypothetical protein